MGAMESAFVILLKHWAEPFPGTQVLRICDKSVQEILKYVNYYLRYIDILIIIIHKVSMAGKVWRLASAFFQRHG